MANKTKKFLVQLECAENTRFFASDSELCEWLHLPIASAINAQTTGPCPKVTITPEETGAMRSDTIPDSAFFDERTSTNFAQVFEG